MSLSEHNILPGLQGPTTYKEYPSISQTLSAKASQATGITNFALPITDSVARVSSTLRYYTADVWAAYPLLRAFVYAFVLLTGVPVGAFLVWATVTLSSCLVVAGIALTVIEGGFIGFGLLCLSPFIFFSFWGALLGAGAFAAVYYGMRLFTVGLDSTQSFTGIQTGTGLMGNTLGMVKNAAAATTDMMAKAECMAVGADGLPAPLSSRI